MRTDHPSDQIPPIGNCLIVGYGNTLRGDDAVGQVIAQMLAARPVGGASIIHCHQLVPELAEQLAAVDVVIFIDAVAGAAPGAVAVSQLFGATRPQPAPGHFADPESLLSLCATLYHRAPRAFLISVGAGSFALGAGLSDPVSRALPTVIDAVSRLVEIRVPDQLRRKSTTEPSGSSN